MGLLKLPQGKNISPQERSKLQLTWQISVLLTILLFFLSISFVWFQINGFVQYTVGFFIALSTLIWTYKSSNGKDVSLFLTICSVLLITSSILFDHDSIHLVDPMWLICIILYSFITHGKKVGLFLVLYSSVLYSSFILLQMDKSLIEFLDSPAKNMYTISIEISACIFIIGYFIKHFIDSIERAETSLVNSNTELTKREKEKTILLQEIHHRVKNNLQIIISLLRMQSNELKSQEAKDAFGTAINRVLSMANIHQRMYEEKDLKEIDVEEYMKTIVNDMIRTHHTQTSVFTSIKSDIQGLNLDTVVPFGLIITELTSNSLKHGLKQEGSITIHLKQLSENEAILEYSDNGIWKAPEQSSFGLELIESLVGQLEGQLERVNNESGTHYVIRFNLLVA